MLSILSKCVEGCRHLYIDGWMAILCKIINMKLLFYEIWAYMLIGWLSALHFQETYGNVLKFDKLFTELPIALVEIILIL